MNARLFAKWGRFAGAEFRIETEALIGRAPESTVCLEDGSVSSQHARIYFDHDRGAYYLEDLDSTNGTRVDGVAARGKERLERLHVLEFGGSGAWFFVCSPRREPAAARVAETTSVDVEIPPLPAALSEASGEPEEAEEPEEGTVIESVAAVLPGALAASADPDEAWLEVREPGAAPRRVRLEPGETVIGRGVDAGIRLHSSDVSRRHAVMVVTGRQVVVRDLGSHNGTEVEGEALAANAEAVLSPPARLRFGNVDAVLHGPLEQQPAEDGAG